MTTLLADLLGLKEFASCYHGNGNCSECPVNEIGGSCQDNGKMLIKDICDKLIPLLEQGRLVKLPCKVGDTVYVIRGRKRNGKYANVVVEKTVKNIEIGHDNHIGFKFGTTDWESASRVFLTREEAEAALNVPDTNIGNIEEGAEQ